MEPPASSSLACSRRTAPTSTDQPVPTRTTLAHWRLIQGHSELSISTSTDHSCRNPYDRLQLCSHGPAFISRSQTVLVRRRLCESAGHRRSQLERHRSRATGERNDTSGWLVRSWATAKLESVTVVADVPKVRPSARPSGASLGAILRFLCTAKAKILHRTTWCLLWSPHGWGSLVLDDSFRACPFIYRLRLRPGKPLVMLISSKTMSVALAIDE